ncbi:MAG TPA: TRAM domain-containing protein, partial [Gemmatimonadales bacterium]|nr:TRAM domain-containing protein [Gemmatimonadales bacterium]
MRILRLAAGGDGVGRLEDGRTVFVPRTAPGDLVELARVREHRRFTRARVARVLEPSPERVVPRCPHYVEDDCGGCQLQHLASSAQRKARRTIVGDALRRIAKLDVADPELVAASEDFEYRTKITLHVDETGRRIGLHPLDRPDYAFELARC